MWVLGVRVQCAPCTQGTQHNDGVNDIAVERSERAGGKRCVYASSTLPYGLRLECVAHIRQRQFRTVLNLPSTWSTLVYIWENAKRAKLQNETKWNETYNITLTMVQIHRKKSLFHHERWDETECTAIKPMRMVFVYIYVSGYRKHWTVAKQPQRSTFSECESIQD